VAIIIRLASKFSPSLVMFPFNTRKSVHGTHQDDIMMWLFIYFATTFRETK